MRRWDEKTWLLWRGSRYGEVAVSRGFSVFLTQYMWWDTIPWGLCISSYFNSPHPYPWDKTILLDSPGQSWSLLAGDGRGGGGWGWLTKGRWWGKGGIQPFITVLSKT